jgi:predicted nucleotidyltransferase
MSAVEQVRALASREPQLVLLVLYGSRARGDARPGSDWDFGYMADAGFDVESFRGALVRIVQCDDVDLVDLSRASAQLRYRVAAEGVTMSGRPGASDAFWFTAVSYWLDMQDIIRSEYEAALQRLPS